MAAGASTAGDVERVPGSGDGRVVPGVEVARLVRGVERDRAQLVREAGEERLREVCAVGVAVEVDRTGAECVEHAIEVAGAVGGGEQVRGVDVAAALPRELMVE